MKKWVSIMILSAILFAPSFGQAAPALGFLGETIDMYQLGPRGNFAAPTCTYVDARVLAASIAESVTIPTGAKCVVFSGNADFYVNWTTAATVPSDDITNGAGSELNPGGRAILNTITSFSIISPTAAIVTMSWYK